VSDDPARDAVDGAQAQPVAAPAPPPRDSTASWLATNRMKLALGIAVAEGIFVAVEKDFSRVTVIVIAIPVILFYLLAGRTLDSRLAREISWVLAMSQALAVVAAIIAIMVPVIALVLAGAFGAVAVYLLFHDRPDRAGGTAPPTE
jgi:hypothetical protein